MGIVLPGEEIRVEWFGVDGVLHTFGESILASEACFFDFLFSRSLALDFLRLTLGDSSRVTFGDSSMETFGDSSMVTLGENSFFLRLEEVSLVDMVLLDVCAGEALRSALGLIPDAT